MGRIVRCVLVCCLMVGVVTQPCLAWHEPGHHIIALLAHDLLSKSEQQELLALLKQHPRFKEDFELPRKLKEESRDRPLSPEELDRWLIGRAGYWPDVARSQPDYNRPTWHFQLGATLTIGDPPGVPANPGPAPAEATLATQELHIAQALTVCRSVLRDRSRPAADRAIAYCWIVHLVGDAHQPCHSGSLYETKVFPEGDRGANSIPTKQSRNLHALWDGLLGSQFDLADVRRRSHVIREDAALWDDAKAAAHKPGGLNPLTWLTESNEAGRQHVYTQEILTPVNAVSRGLAPSLTMIDLSEDYLKNAGQVSRQRAAVAAHRLASLLHKDLAGNE